MSNKLYYRLCRRDLNGNLISWFCTYLTEELALDYHIGKTTWAHLGTIGIFIFPSLQDAIIYDELCPDKIIVSGEAIEPRRQLVIVKPTMLSTWFKSKDWCNAFQKYSAYKDHPYCGIPNLYTCAGFIPKEII